MDVVEDDTAPKTGHGAGNLVCTLPGTKEADTIYFTSHMDTVVPGKGVKPVIEDGYVKTDGTTILGADDKTGLAAMLEAVKVLKEKNIPHGTIQFIITVGEESGLVGAKALDRSLIKADYGYALDSDGKVGNIIVAAPTQAKIRATVYGKTAHAGVEPEKESPRSRSLQKRLPKCRLAASTRRRRLISAALRAERKPISSAIRSTFSLKPVRLFRKNGKADRKMKQAFEAAAAEMGGRARWKSKSCTRALNTKTGISSLKSPKKPPGKSAVRTSY